MPETAITPVSSPSKWSTAGQALTMAALDNANGNEFAASGDQLIIVQNTHVSALSVQFTSQPEAATGRSGSINQSLAASEIRIFRMTKNGWADSDGNVLMPTGQNALLKVAIVDL